MVGIPLLYRFIDGRSFKVVFFAAAIGHDSNVCSRSGSSNLVRLAAPPLLSCALYYCFCLKKYPQSVVQQCGVCVHSSLSGCFSNALSSWTFRKFFDLVTKQEQLKLSSKQS